MSIVENQLETDFEKAFNEVHDQIQLKLTQAAKLIEEAVKLSEDSGVPFKPEEPLTFVRPSYIPRSMEKKFPDIDQDFVAELTDAYGYDAGWQWSQVCG